MGSICFHRRPHLDNPIRPTSSCDNFAPVLVFTPRNTPAAISFPVGKTCAAWSGGTGGLLQPLLEGLGDKRGRGTVECGMCLGRGGEGESVCTGEVSWRGPCDDALHVQFFYKLPGSKGGLFYAFVDT